jgi:hypothetical protein
MAEKIFNNQTNYGWGLTFNLTGKAPAINKRIFDTLSDAEAYANDFNDSAIEGLLLSVVSEADEKNNGVYFVQRIKKDAEDNEGARLIKVGSLDVDGVNLLINSKIGDGLGEDETVLGYVNSSVSNINNSLTTINNSISDINRVIEEKTTEISNIIGDISDGENIIGIISDVQNTVAENKQTIDDYTINDKKISESPKLNSDDFKISGEYSSTVEGNVTPDDTVTSAIGKIEFLLKESIKAFAASLNDLEERIGNPKEYDESGELVKDSTGLYEDLDNLNEYLGKLEINSGEYYGNVNQ